jgi:hypothetical protein
MTAWDPSTSGWGTVVVAVAAVAAVGVTRPWRFWWSRRHCPQCDKLLPRWDCWGWKVAWTCRRCGCQIGR